MKTIVITGASDGIGAAAARRLHHDGHRVVVVGRSAEKTEAVARELGAEHFLADFTRLDEVRALARDLNAAYPRIDVLANNAGGVFRAAPKTVDGFEITFQINHLAPFLLTRLLLENLIASNATVIQTSSVGSRMAKRLDLGDLNNERDFSAVAAYNASKLENILFTKELHRRFHPEGISTAAFHPGNIATSFGSDTDSRIIKFIVTNPIARSLLLSSPEKGAAQLVWLAEAHPGHDWESGAYYEKRKQPRRTNPLALHAKLARDLWERSEQLIGWPEQTRAFA